ncbi:MAG: ABC transporter permease [Candidatus Portnoybacteria bacterium]|nr:ABC transporter permease [Candidatus Portnoybacteria bacterium]
MKKFLTLLKKEIQELLTPQMLVPLLVIVVVFVFVGKIIGKETSKAKAPQAIEILDLDKSATSQQVISIIEKTNFLPNVSHSGGAEEVIAKAKEKNAKVALIIPSGFEAGIKNFQPQKMEVYTIMKNFSVMASVNSQILKAALGAINDGLSNQLLANSNPKIDPIAIKQPVLADDFVVIGEKQANISPTLVSGFITSQTTFIPIILFLVIVLASQLIATSIATEKENKTLETLLSSPISRKAVVASKLMAAGLVALLTAGVYLFGMRYYMSGITGGAIGGAAATDEASKAAIAQLGLTLSTPDYLMLGLSLFLGILAALAIAIILGSFAEDSKAAQGVVAPLMVLVLIPYILTMFLDVSSFSSGMKILIWLIPFSHPFMAAPNLLLGQTSSVWYGILYLAFFFVVFVFIAAKIFASDKIFTMKISFKKKRP